MKEDVCLIVATNWKPNRVDFLSALGISVGGLGEQLFSTVFDCLFVTSIEVRGEFKKYYSVEYASLSEYIKIRYNKVLSEKDSESAQVFLITWLPQILNTSYEENQLSTVLECIQSLEVLQNEDKI
ncbi:hypothetical protein RA180_21985 [Aeromonas salmonicida]|uniref:hypothetical protein n=1 Tax=Aeromonas salmonicida TaxID=645 RepID=UPI00279642A4|nr:hypothetical protein [Aeromonas salmonicida]MDQ1886663.1 hypothetical protein [Aeromonas salmonicida]